MNMQQDIKNCINQKQHTNTDTPETATKQKSIFISILMKLIKYIGIVILFLISFTIFTRLYSHFFYNNLVRSFPSTPIAQIFYVKNLILSVIIGITILLSTLCIFNKTRKSCFFVILILLIEMILAVKLIDFTTNLDIIDKPIIYLYPTEQTEVTVKLGNPQKLTHTYPKYKDKWQVIAQPNGDLTDIQTKRSLYALYWEGVNNDNNETTTGFIVKDEDTISFLEEKLAVLGLNEREANEFIIYWLPRLESSPYNLIYFKTIAEQDKNMPLYISPKPDTIIRVMMAFKNLNEPIKVTEQILPPIPQRNGFTVVEWGGTDLTGNIVR